MNRRTALAVTFIVLNLMACCCGGVVPVEKNPVAPAAEVKPQIKVHVAAAPKAEPVKLVDTGFVPAVFVLPPMPALPPHDFAPILSASYKHAFDSVNIELVGAEIEHSGSSHLAVKVRVHNDGLVPIKYIPWHESNPPLFASDEHGNTFPALSASSPSSGKWLVESPKTIKIGEKLITVVAFAAPLPQSQEFDFQLPGKNVSTPETKSFSFKIGRSFFAKKEDVRLAKEYAKEQRAAFDRAEARRRDDFVRAEKEAAISESLPLEGRGTVEGVTYDVTFKRQSADLQLLDLVFFHKTPSPEMVDKLLKKALVKAVQKNATIDILAMAFLDDRTLTSQEFSGLLFYKASEKKILTDDEWKGVITTSESRANYFVQIKEEKTLAGITPERSWLVLHVVYPSEIHPTLAYRDIEREVELLKKKSLDVTAYANVGDKNKSTSWRQLKDDNGRFVFATYSVKSGYLTRQGR